MGMTMMQTHSLYELDTRARSALAAGATYRFRAVGNEYIEISYVSGGRFINVAHRIERRDGEPGAVTMQTNTLPSAELGFQVDRFSEWSATLLAQVGRRTHSLDDVLRSGVVHGIAEAAKTLKARWEAIEIPTDVDDYRRPFLIPAKAEARAAYRAVLALLDESIDETLSRSEAQAQA